MSSWNPSLFCSQRRTASSSLNSHGSGEVQNQQEIMGDSPEKVTNLRTKSGQSGVQGLGQDCDRHAAAGHWGQKSELGLTAEMMDG